MEKKITISHFCQSRASYTETNLLFSQTFVAQSEKEAQIRAPTCASETLVPWRREKSEKCFMNFSSIQLHNSYSFEFQTIFQTPCVPSLYKYTECFPDLVFYINLERKTVLFLV